jgi:hypothetical protein
VKILISGCKDLVSKEDRANSKAFNRAFSDYSSRLFVLKELTGTVMEETN